MDTRHPPPVPDRLRRATGGRPWPRSGRGHLARAAPARAADPLPVGSKILVIVTLYGGNDGLNTLIPYADRPTTTARPELAYAESEVLHLDERLGLNPAMNGTGWAMAARDSWPIVRGVGYPKPDHSHFRSMDIWQTASPGPPGQHRLDRPLAGRDRRRPAAGGERRSRAAAARRRRATRPRPRCRWVATCRCPADLAAGADAGWASRTRPTRRPQALVRASYRAERTAAATFATVLDPTPRAGPTISTLRRASAGGQQQPRAQLDVVARCIKAGVPTRVYSVSLGGFDTHADEKGTQQTQLGELDRRVTGFLAGHGRTDPRGARRRRCWSTPSSAGGSPPTPRRAPTTAPPARCSSPGARSAAASTATQPSPDRPRQRATSRSSTDFRDVYAELLHKLLDTDPARVLGNSRSELGFLA